MAEGEDYSPGVWAGHDFSAARKHYDATAGRSYEDAQASGKSQADLCPPTIATQASYLLVLLVDETGSMQEWPGTVFSKAPYLDHEMRTEYGAEDAVISVAAIGDAHNLEDFPLQVRPFASGTAIKDRLAELVHEGKGGGTKHETYELAALYYARNCAMPNVSSKPPLIFIGDESCYDQVTPGFAKTHARTTLNESMSTAEVFRELKEKFAVYFIQKPYYDGSEPVITRRVHADWAALIGEDHIASLAEAGRVVDVIFGIMAKESGKVDYFYRELTARQTPEQVATVRAALSAIHRVQSASDGQPQKPNGGKSVIRLRRD